MCSAKRLVVTSAFGSALNQTVLLAAHPDETHDRNGDPRADARTLVLSLAGDRAVFVEELPLPLYGSAWSSSGTAYCGSIDRSTIHKWRAGKWSEETFSDKPVAFLRYLFAVPGKTPAEDSLFLASAKKLFIRQAGVWTSKRAPGEGFPYQMDGSTADHVYVGGAELSLWNGKKLKVLESPDDDTIDGLALSHDDRLVGGNSYVSISTPAGGWDRIDTPVKNFPAFARFDGHVYALSGKRGVLRVYPGDVEIVTRPLDAVGLVSVGDGLIAIGMDGVLAYDGTSWKEIDLPSCELGKLPR